MIDINSLRAIIKLNLDRHWKSTMNQSEAIYPDLTDIKLDQSEADCDSMDSLISSSSNSA